MVNCYTSLGSWWTSIFIVLVVSDELLELAQLEKPAWQSDVAWPDVLNWLLMVMPRFEMDPEKLTVDCSSCSSFTDSLSNCCFVPSHNSWVLLVFIFSWLLLIQASVCSMHKMKHTVVDVDVAGLEHLSKVNSKLFCFKGRSSTFRLFRFRFIATFFTRLLRAGHFYASVLLWTMNYEWCTPEYHRHMNAWLNQHR